MPSQVLHCTKRYPDGTVRVWTEEYGSGKFLKEDPEEAKKMKEYMDRIDPKRSDRP